jgi:hypothetical protein
MCQRLSVSNQRPTATKRMMLRCGCVGLSFLAIVGFGLLQKVQAAENILPDRQVSAASTKIQPKLVTSYGKLPLSFEANQGQVNGPVQFLSRGVGYMLFLTGDEAVLELEKSSVLSGQSSVGTRQNPSVAPTFRSAGAGLKSGATTSVDMPTTDHGPRTTNSVLRMKLVGANASAAVTGAEELPGKSNYFIGSDPTKWRTNVPNYAQVRYQDVYPGVDLVYYGTQGGQLEYDFVVAPGADAHSIGLSFQGAGHIRVDRGTGDLVLALAGSDLRFRKPVVYQEQFAVDSSQLTVQDEKRNTTDNPKSKIQNRQFLDGRFVLTGTNRIGFQVAAYDRRAPLIIDPVLVYSTYLGGGQYNIGYRVAVDASGSAYVAGATNSSDFPTTAGVFSSMLHPGGCPLYHHRISFACPDAFVTKLDPAGTQLVYSTYLGGSAPDAATGISVDSSGNAYVTGSTSSTDFPTTLGAFQTSATDTSARIHAFATKLNATGSVLIYSTYLAGTQYDVSTVSALDSGGNLYVAGGTNSADFPTTRGAFQPAIAGTSCIHDGLPVPCVDGFIAKLNPQGSALIYSTFLGGSNHDAVLGLAIDSTGSVYATGGTLSTDFPVANALQPSFGPTTCGTTQGGSPRPCFHAFVTKLNSTGTALDYSTYLGGNGDDAGIGIAVDETGAAYVTGATNSTNFPTTTGAAQTSFGGGTCGNLSSPFDCPDAFLAKLDPLGTSLAYSTYLGGSGFDFGWGIALDNAKNAYVVGGTDSLDFPTADPIQAFLKGGSCSIPSTYLGNAPIQGFSFNCPNAFLTKIDPTGTTRLFSTYLGGGSGDFAFSVAVDASGGSYLAGSTLSPTFPTANPLQPSMTGYADAFISKFSLVPSAHLSPGSLTFCALETQYPTSISPQTVTLSNTGNAPLELNSMWLVGDFTQNNNCLRSVAAGANCTITVTFNPPRGARGVWTGSLTIGDNAHPSSQTLSLIGIISDFFPIGGRGCR